jgi:hypothetical protein
MDWPLRATSECFGWETMLLLFRQRDRRNTYSVPKTQSGIHVVTESYHHGPACGVELHSAAICYSRYIHHFSHPHDVPGDCGSFGQYGWVLILYSGQGGQIETQERKKGTGTT